jgi:hypothetical protein
VAFLKRAKESLPCRKKGKKVGKNVSNKQPKKGELDLDDLRKNKEINKIVEKQLRYLLFR